MSPSRLLILPVLLLATGALGADWPEWRGPGRRGSWDDARLPARLAPEAVRTRWRVPVGGGYSGIAVVGGKVFTLDRPSPGGKERVLCADAGTGRTLWTHEYAAEYGDLDHGNGPRSTPTWSAGKVYTIGAMGHIHCLDAATGKVHWAIDLVAALRAKIPTWGHAASPLVLDDLVIFQAGAQPGGTVLALDAATGKERWRALDDRPGYSSPILIEAPSMPEPGRPPGAPSRQIAAWTADSVAGLAPRTGDLLWRVPYKSTYDVAIISPVFHDGVLLVSGYWEGAKAVDLARGEPRVLWEGKSLSCLMSTPLHRDGHLYALDKEDGLLCMEWRTGKVIWKDSHRMTPKGRNPHATLVWAGKSAVALNELGELILLRLSPGGYEELGRAPILGRTWAHPAFAGQLVFARNDAELVCVEVLPGG